ncbi:MAG: hypothetical protein BRD29_04160 [Bacteroidetes bacterium QH_2_67_10]|nr:MAG: hypothetical protein BRD29_04160 [Bacteroidetes bacterium QH_2_67_10]
MYFLAKKTYLLPMRLCSPIRPPHVLTLPILLLAASLLLPVAAQAQEPVVTQDPSEPLSERHEITAADRDTSDFNKQTIRRQILAPYKTLDSDDMETGLLYDRRQQNC